MRNKGGIIILGRGGHARSIRDVVESIRTYSISSGGMLCIDDMVDCTPLLPIVDGKKYVVGFGSLDDLKRREEVADHVLSHGGKLVTLISPHAIVSPRAEIHEGTVVMPGAYIGPGARVGKNCIINTGAIVEHDCTLGDNVHVSTGAILNGNCCVFSNTLVGSGAVVRQGIKIWHGITIGCGAVVVSNLVKPDTTYIGCPAKEMP